MLLRNSYTSVIVTEQIDFVSITFINTSLAGLMISTIFCTMSCHACTRKVLYTVHVLSFNFMDIDIDYHQGGTGATYRRYSHI